MVRIFLILIFSFSCLSSNLGVESLFKDQVKDYKSNKWSKVFARGHFYRHNFLRNNEEVKAAFSPSLYKLEIYALAEKCQWVLVEELFKDFKRLENIKFNNASNSNEIRSKIETFKAYKFVSKESSIDTLSKNDYSNSLLADGISWSELENVENIEIEVEDLCQK